jgi:alpha-N-arabinofuranosidase
MNPRNTTGIECKVEGISPKNVSGRVLTAEVMNAHNTFEKPRAVEPTVFDDFRLVDDVLTVRLPAKSVTVLEME